MKALPKLKAGAKVTAGDYNRLLDYVNANRLTSANRGIAISRNASGAHLMLTNAVRAATNAAQEAASGTTPTVTAGLFLGRVVYFERALGPAAVNPTDATDIVSIWNYGIKPVTIPRASVTDPPDSFRLDEIVRAVADGVPALWRTAVNVSTVTLWAMNLIELRDPRVTTTVDMTTDPPTKTITYGAGVHGNGVDSANIPATMAIMPIPIGTVLFCYSTGDKVESYGPTFKDRRIVATWLQYENAIDGSCS